jgi:hypothetical protein
MNIYCIYDNNSKTYGTPFFQPSDVHAMREFRTAVNRESPGNMIFLYPREFDLVALGSFDELEGTLTTFDDNKPRRLANGATVITKNEGETK